MSHRVPCSVWRRTLACLANLTALAAGLVPIESAFAKEAPAIDRLVGARVADFQLTDAVSGREVTLPGTGNAATVVVFTSVDCPIGNSYMPRLVELRQAYAGRGVAMYAINTNNSRPRDEVARHASEFHLNFPVLLDTEGAVTRQLQGETICETLVIDGAHTLRYRGAIDDQYGYGTRREQPVHNHLVDALEAILANKPVETSATSVVGCPIEALPQVRPTARIQPVSAEAIAATNALDPEVDPDSLGPLSFADNAASILQNKCQGCHRPGQVGPFSLVTYDDARRHADGIHQALSSHRMPPWQADPRHGKFANDRRLSSRERATLLAWIEQGTPRGNPADDPAPRAWPDGWTIGTPDVVFEIPKPYTVKPDGVLPYQRFRVKTGFTEDRWVQAIEPQPTDRAAVHHIVIYLVDPSKRTRRFDDLEHIAAYAPGDLPSVFPPGAAKLIPANAELIFEIHYTPDGRAHIDQSRLGMIFAKEPPRARVRTIAVANGGFKLAPNSADTKVESEFTFPKDAELVGLLPHMHLRGKSFTYTAKFPDGREEVLLSVPKYDFAWQTYYWLDTPMAMPKGTRIHCEAHFDNSSGNPLLTPADVNQAVTWGEQTFEEMMIGYIDVLTPIEKSESAEKLSSLP